MSYDLTNQILFSKNLYDSVSNSYLSLADSLNKLSSMNQIPMDYIDNTIEKFRCGINKYILSINEITEKRFLEHYGHIRELQHTIFSHEKRIIGLEEKINLLYKKHEEVSAEKEELKDYNFIQ